MTIDDHIFQQSSTKLLCLLAGFSQFKLFDLRATGFPFEKGKKEVKVSITFVPGMSSLKPNGKMVFIVLFVLENIVTSLVLVANASLQLRNSDEPLFVIAENYDLCDETLPIGLHCPLPANSIQNVFVHSAESAHRNVYFCRASDKESALLLGKCLRFLI